VQEVNDGVEEATALSYHHHGPNFGL